MQEEARDFEVLRAELDARMRELAGEAGNQISQPPDIDRVKTIGSLAPAEPVRRDELSPPQQDQADRFRTLEEVERDYILRVLLARKWRISGPRGAALTLGLNPSTLRSRMKKLGIARDISRNR